jgi:hypothetical protein
MALFDQCMPTMRRTPDQLKPELAPAVSWLNSQALFSGYTTVLLCCETFHSGPDPWYWKVTSPARKSLASDGRRSCRSLAGDESTSSASFHSRSIHPAVIHVKSLRPTALAPSGSTDTAAAFPAARQARAPRPVPASHRHSS